MEFKRVSLKKAFQVGAMTKHRRTTALADFILGSQDGMVNVLGIVLGVAIASQDLRLIYVGGLAALILYLIEWYKAKLTIGKPNRSGIQMIAIGYLRLW